MIADEPNFIKRSEMDWHLLEQGSATALVSPSLTIVTLLEVISVVISVLIINWAIVPIYPFSRWPLIVPVFLTLTFIIYSQIQHGESWDNLGFSQRYFSAALRMLFLPVAFSCVTLLAVGYIANSIHRSTHFGANLFVIPFWGVVQQFVLQGFFYRRIRFLSFRVLSVRASQSQKIWLAILPTAGLFAIVHLPNLTLASLTLIAAIVWTWVYEQAPNIWALGLSHGLLSLVLMHSLPLQYLHSMSVGYKHFLYQLF